MEVLNVEVLNVEVLNVVDGVLWFAGRAGS